MDSYQTKIASVDDLDVVATLFDSYRQFYEQQPDPVAARDFIRERIERDESVILLALNEQGEAMGFCQLYPLFCSIEAKPIYQLSDLYVVPAARKLGVGRRLLLAAEQLSAAHGKVRMELTTARNNRAAQSVYESLGWVRDEIYYAYSKRVSL